MNRRIFNNRESIARRRQLRTNATPQEILLWSKLRNDQLGVRFRRQYGIGSFIVDFYCPERRLAIEIDGSQHFENEARAHDAERTSFLKKHGCTVLRFTNAEVNTNRAGIVLAIQKALATPPAPSCEEGD